MIFFAMKISGMLRRAADFLESLARAAEPGAQTVSYPWRESYPKGISWHLDLEPRPLFSIVDEAAAKFGKRPCLNFLGKRLSYRKVSRLVDRAARGFQNLGVRNGVKVGLFLPNSPYYVVCFHAVLKAGGTVVNLNPLYAEHEIARLIRDSETRIVVTMNLKSLYPKVAPRLADTCLEQIVVCPMSSVLPFPKNALFSFFHREEIVPVSSDETHVMFSSLIADKGDLEPVAIDPQRDIAVLQYTGGTTGTPKGAMLSHGNLHTNTAQIRIWAAEAKPGREKFLAVLPLCHAFGMTAVMNFGLSIGAEIVLLPRFKVAEVLRVISRARPTVLIGVPALFSALSAHNSRGRYDLSSLRFCISGGAPLPLQVKSDFERISGSNLVEGYGLTEAGPVCTVNPLTGPGKAGSVGLPLPGTIVEIVSLDNPKKILPPGKLGEIVISGPQVMVGYWRREGETRAVLRQGRLRTGDVGYLDPDGYLFVVDRIKDMIITGGYNVYPRMVEEAIRLHPSVEEAAVCGVPDRHHGEIVKAYIKLRHGAELTAAELRFFLRDKLASFEIPREIEFLQEMPKTLIGKPSRKELVARELRRREREARPPMRSSLRALWRSWMSRARPSA